MTMKQVLNPCVALVALTLLSFVPSSSAPAASLDGLFTYQGKLEQNGVPADGTCDFQFSLWDAAGSGSPPSGGTQIGFTLPSANRVVTNGLFTVQLNFGAGVFTGEERWLQIAVRCPDGAGSYTTLSPRQQLTATPYALYAPSAGTAGNLACTTCVGSSDLANGAVTSDKIAPGTIQPSNLAFTPGTLTSITAGTGLTGGTITNSGTIAANVGTGPGTVAAGNHAHDLSYWHLGGNAGLSGGNYLGTIDNQALELRVSGARALQILPATVPNLVGGWGGNTVQTGVIGAVIAGGGNPDLGGGVAPNMVTDNYGTVGGGASNTAGNSNGDVADVLYPTVGGGMENRATGSLTTVGGGAYNIASGFGAVVAGGGTWVRGCPPNNFCRAAPNRATGDISVVGGGLENTAGPGEGTTVAGGFWNVAQSLGATVCGGGWNESRGEYATIGGGLLNKVDGFRATVGGGQSNVVSGGYCTVGGGVNNACGGWGATVAGGTDNSAGGSLGFVAGNRAKIATGASGSFVWGDSSAADIWSWNSNEFVARANGGFWFVTKVDSDGYPIEGMRLPSGQSAWIPLGSTTSASTATLREESDAIAALRAENASLRKRMEELETRVALMEAGHQ
jgi:trimeric autotransporter adhesin